MQSRRFGRKLIPMMCGGESCLEWCNCGLGGLQFGGGLWLRVKLRCALTLDLRLENIVDIFCRKDGRDGIYPRLKSSIFFWTGVHGK